MDELLLEQIAAKIHVLAQRRMPTVFLLLLGPWQQHPSS
jgi:hypothetical protein